MTIARKYLIDHTQTCFYHCMSRCVEQRFLLNDNKSGGEKRSQWIESWLLFLGNIFAIDVLSYAIMGNHTHAVFYVNYELLNSWDNAEILRRRMELGKVPEVCHLFVNNETRSSMTEIELTIVLDLVEKYREELINISGLMGRLNSHIAHRANKEDGRKGHFWEGRFKSQALLNDEAVLACMAYVDLNPARAGLSKTLIKAKHTSIRRRLLKTQNANKTLLMPFRDIINQVYTPNVCKLSLEAYMKVINRVLKKKDFDDLMQHFTKFIKNKDNWRTLALSFESEVEIAAGDKELVNQFEKQARLNSYATETHFKTIAAKILFELRDNQYQSDKTR